MRKCLSGRMPSVLHMSSNTDEPIRLRLLTFENLPQPPDQDCDGGYTCLCAQHQAERDAAVARGVRRDRSSPFKRAA